jgi:hypothetical protein
MFGVSGISANPDELIKVLQLQTNWCILAQLNNYYVTRKW